MVVSVVPSIPSFPATCQPAFSFPGHWNGQRSSCWPRASAATKDHAYLELGKQPRGCGLVGNMQQPLLRRTKSAIDGGERLEPAETRVAPAEAAAEEKEAEAAQSAETQSESVLVERLAMGNMWRVYGGLLKGATIEPQYC